MNNISGFLMNDIFMPLMNSLWQAAAIVGLVWLIMRFLPRVNAATRYAIWWVVLAVVLFLPWAPTLHQRSQPASAVVRSSTGSSINPLLPEIEAPAIVRLQSVAPPKWPLALAAVWAAAFLIRLTRIARSFCYLRRVKAGARVSPGLLPQIGRNARLLFSDGISSPIAVGFLKPAVILPESLTSELGKAEFDHVVLHEAAHLSRKDDWTNLGARLLEAALILHVVVVWILGRIDREREIACDEWVVTHTGNPRGYAVSLARMHELRWAQREEALASGVFGRGSRLAERIELLIERGRDFSGCVSGRRVLFSATILLAVAAASSRFPRWIAFAQQPPRPSFEVASVKPGNPNSGRFGFGRRGNEFIADNAPLSILISAAYNVQVHQIFGGPRWVNTDRFTIEAKPNAAIRIPEGPEGMNQLNQMLQSLLQERFKLALHRETRTEQVYELIVAKGGPKLRESAGPGADSRTGIWNTGRPGEVAGYDVAVANLVALVSQRLGAPVIDKTGLSAKYDFKLSFISEPTPQDAAIFGPPPPGANPPADSGLPSIFAALPEQLGLKLQSTRGPVEVLVVDRADKPEPN